MNNWNLATHQLLLYGSGLVGGFHSWLAAIWTGTRLDHSLRGIRIPLVDGSFSLFPSMATPDGAPSATIGQSQSVMATLEDIKKQCIELKDRLVHMIHVSNPLSISHVRTILQNICEFHKW